MELLNIGVARAVWFLDIAELNPRGKTIMPDLLDWLKENYHFGQAPSSITDLDKDTKALVFERGQFQIKEELFIDVGLKIYNDGFVAETQSSTHGSDAFLKDALELAVKDFNLAYKPQMVRRKLYFSELYVSSEKQLIGINPELSNFAAKIAELLPSKMEISYEFAGFSFWPTKAMPHAVLSPFRFERKIGTLPEENKYYSAAPTHTDDHLRLLDDFEAAFMS
jgi:hypothetical protein